VRYCRLGPCISTGVYLTAPSPLLFFPEQLLFLLQKLLLSPLGLIVILMDFVYSDSQGSKYGRCFYKCDLTYYCRVLLLLIFFALLLLVLRYEICNIPISL
jgi:hypothetical protein